MSSLRMRRGSGCGPMGNSFRSSRRQSFPKTRIPTGQRAKLPRTFFGPPKFASGPARRSGIRRLPGRQVCAPRPRKGLGDSPALLGRSDHVLDFVDQGKGCFHGLLGRLFIGDQVAKLVVQLVVARAQFLAKTGFFQGDGDIENTIRNRFTVYLDRIPFKGKTSYY